MFNSKRLVAIPPTIEMVGFLAALIMKEPEKIYLCPSDLACIDYEEEWLEYPFGDNCIEYTRTDAFIEKAWNWIENNILPSNQKDKSLLYYEQFKKYMKGE